MPLPVLQLLLQLLLLSLLMFFCLTICTGLCVNNLNYSKQKASTYLTWQSNLLKGIYEYRYFKFTGNHIIHVTRRSRQFTNLKLRFPPLPRPPREHLIAGRTFSTKTSKFVYYTILLEKLSRDSSPNRIMPSVLFELFGTVRQMSTIHCISICYLLPQFQVPLSVFLSLHI